MCGGGSLWLCVSELHTLMPMIVEQGNGMNFHYDIQQFTSILLMN